MKLPNPYQCDREGCTVTKAKSNGWWLVYSPDGSWHFDIIPWDEAHVDDTGVKHLCSENCVLVMLGGWMAEMHRRPEATPEPEQAVSIRKEVAL